MEERFDPMTGEPIKETTKEQPSGGFDPMTGEPIKETTKEQPSGGFDPMTGEPIKETSKEQPSGGFDPMTGQPIWQTSQNLNDSPKKKNKVWILAIPVAVVVIAIGAVAALMSGAFLSTPQKVAVATMNTIKNAKPKVLKDLKWDDALKLSSSGKASVCMSGSIEGVDIDVTVTDTGKEKTVAGEVSVYGQSVEAQAMLTSNQLKVAVPSFTEDVFVYNYLEEADGYLVDVIEDSGVKMESLTEALQMLYEGKDTSKEAKAFEKVLAEQVDTLEWEKADAETFKIDGKSKKAKGYKTEITDDFAKDILNAVEDFLEETNEASYDVLKEKGIFNELEEAFDEMPDYEVTFYIQKNMLAAVEICDDKSDMTISLCFAGGDFRMQNMELECETAYDRETMEFEGESDGEKETYELSCDGETIFTFTYDSSDQKYEFVTGEGDDEEIIEGEITTTGGSYGFTMELEDQMDMSITVCKPIEMESISGEEVDIMNMDESELYLLMSAFSSEYQNSL